mgnify:CR=1 FL=1
MGKGGTLIMSVYVHGDNILQKENHPSKYRDETSKQYLVEIRAKYEEWKAGYRTFLMQGERIVSSISDDSLLFFYQTNLKEIIINYLYDFYYGMFQGMTKDDARAFKEFNSLSDSDKRLDNRLVPENNVRRAATLNEYSMKLKKPIKNKELICYGFLYKQ